MFTGCSFPEDPLASNLSLKSFVNVSLSQKCLHILQLFPGSFHPLEVAFGAAARCARVRGGFHAVGVFDPGSTVSSPTSLSTQSPWHLRSSYNIADRSENAVSYRSVFGEFFTTTTETTCQPKTAQSRAGSTETRSESVSTTSPQHY
jgi:hypothetical protein